MKSIALLLEDHRRILQALEILEDIASRAKHGQEPNEPDLKDLLDFLDGFADRIHQGREESILFPVLLRDRNQKKYEKLKRFVFGHDRQRFLIQGLQESLWTSKKKNFVFCATRLAEVLREHLAEEETQLFPLADTSFLRAEDPRMVAEMEDYDKRWQAKKVPVLLKRIEELETKYLGKTHSKRPSTPRRAGTGDRKTPSQTSQKDSGKGNPAARSLLPGSTMKK